MELEEIKKDRESIIAEIKALNAKYQGALEYLALKEKEHEKKETPKEN